MPTRTCLFCRRAADKALLLRFVSSGGRLTADPGQREPGRGAYTCRTRACIEGAFKRKSAFSRALKAQLAMPAPEAVEKIIREAGV